MIFWGLSLPFINGCPCSVPVSGRVIHHHLIDYAGPLVKDVPDQKKVSFF